MQLWRIPATLIVALAAVLSTACAPASYAVRTPNASDWQYANRGEQAGTLSLVDRRDGSDLEFSTGTLPAGLTLNGEPIDPPEFLRANLQRELDARGLAVAVNESVGGLPRLELNTFRMVNHRQNGFSPFVTFTYFAADLHVGSLVRRIGVFIKRAKVPVWSFEEVVEPTINQPLELAVRELASKINSALNGARTDDATFAQLKERASHVGADRWMAVYALGFSNRPEAIAPIMALLSNEDEYVRLAAISSIGTLGATERLADLKNIYEDQSRIWQDRAMALKSIGDLATPESQQYLATQRAYWAGQPSGKETDWTLRVIDLYL